MMKIIKCNGGYCECTNCEHCNHVCVPWYPVFMIGFVLGVSIIPILQLLFGA